MGSVNDDDIPLRTMRVSLKKKYKVIRKVKEHNRKKAKEAKKLRLSGKNKVEKDPCIPNNWPFKEQELKVLEARRTEAIEELEQKKAEHKERARKRKLGLLEDEDDSKLLEDSNKNTNDFEIKSKRVSLKKKYKVIRKVKEHNRKKGKEATKLRLSGKNKVEKDPGIPNNWPFKEHELKALEARRTKAIEELEQKEAERKERCSQREIKSKRVSLKKKYKVIRKVKEHNRKKGKVAKKLRLSGKNKVEKDPGIPNNWPFKEHELKALEARRTKAIKELEQKKAERKEREHELKALEARMTKAIEELEQKKAEHKERARRRKLGLLEEEYDSKLLEDSNKNTNDFDNAAKTREKKAKEAKKLRLSGNNKVEKDPGIPNNWPFKEQELKVVEARRTKAIEEFEQKTAERKERACRRKLGLLEEEYDSKLLEDSNKDTNDFGNAAKTRESKSKRVSFKNKYKVIRKVKEHNRKKAKEAKKLRLSGKNKVEKDPSIPNNWPFKEQELKALEARRTKAIEELEQKKVEHKERKAHHLKLFFPNFIFYLTLHQPWRLLTAKSPATRPTTVPASIIVLPVTAAPPLSNARSTTAWPPCLRLSSALSTSCYSNVIKPLP
ncbi:trichohyalin-like [Vigna unguiculata]|uniref:trichohyalin-like n=1 Tax=Vigna unguiculata TaxID=3917 RepID=UPI0010168373|nr:trichohyalin-like [Vigna unguiculata]